jgi:S1-C subfamily serine protease
VTAVGNAGGDGGAPSVVHGQVTGLDQAITASDAGGANAERLTGLIEMNAPLQPGDSGGPLYNANGEVVGMNTAASANRRFRSNTADAYAIPLAKALTVVHQIESGQASSTVTIGVPGFLGVSVDPNANGAVVTDIVPGTPAEHIGLQNGDTITSVDGKAVTSSDALRSVLHTKHPGDQVTVAWTDQSGSTHSAKATLATGPVA